MKMISDILIVVIVFIVIEACAYGGMQVWSGVIYIMTAVVSADALAELYADCEVVSNETKPEKKL